MYVGPTLLYYQFQGIQKHINSFECSKSSYGAKRKLLYSRHNRIWLYGRVKASIDHFYFPIRKMSYKTFTSFTYTNELIRSMKNATSYGLIIQPSESVFPSGIKLDVINAMFDVNSLDTVPLCEESTKQ